MILEEVKQLVQPELDQDFDALYEEFAHETGGHDIVEFLMHLQDYGLISEELVKRLANEETLARDTKTGKRLEPKEPNPAVPRQSIEWTEQEEAPEDSTLVANAEMLQQMTERAKATPIATPPLDYADAPTGNQADTAASIRSRPIVFDDHSDDELSTQKRTMFRKRRDGNWEETDSFPAKPPQPRRKRRRPEAKPLPQSHYSVVGLVGEGAMGVVHLAKDEILHRKIAYKVMSDAIADQPALASKFSAEAQITAQLEHPNIVPVYALEGDEAYTMKLIRGKTVEALIAETRAYFKGGQVPDEDHALEARLDVFLKVCDAISYAHARGVVHRDLKPENVMLGEFGEVYVMDWGIAHLMPGAEDGLVVQAMEDEGDLIIGTPGYMSPEQADGRTEELTGASDQYALGLILQELLTLKPAVTGKTPLHILTRHQEGEVDRIVHISRKSVPGELAAIIQKATALQPSARFASVDELADDIRRYIRGDAVHAKPDNPWQALVRWTGRHRQLSLLFVMMSLFASALFVMLVIVYAQVSLSSAYAREQSVSQLVTTVGRKASDIDGQLLRMEGLLLIISTTAEDMLTLGESSGGGIYLASDFDSPERSPPDTSPSKRYGVPISTQHSAFVLAPDTPPSTRHEILPRLRPMNRHFQKVMLRSKSEDASQFTPKRAARALSDVGVPIAWSYLALTNGAYDVYPGHGGYDDYDPRTKPWYAAAAAADGPVWSLPAPDDDGGDVGLVVSCSTPLHSPQGDLLGVAGIDVRFEHLADLLSAEDLPGTTAYILDAEGNILVDPERMKTQSAAGRSFRPKRFGNDEVVTGVLEQRSGYVEAGGEIIVYTPMGSMDWYYVVRGPTNAMLDAVR